MIGDPVRRFFFNIYDGVSKLDSEGTELVDWHEARIEAIRLAGAVIKDNALSIAVRDDWRIEVTDDQGLILLRFDFVALLAPVLSRERRYTGAVT